MDAFLAQRASPGKGTPRAHVPGMEDLRVPKRAVLVEVVLPGGDARGVSVFLGEGAETHEGPERLSDLLNGGAPRSSRPRTRGAGS